METFHADEKRVTVIFPNETANFASLDLNTLLQLADQQGVKDFNVYKDGVALTSKDFPLTNGEIKIVPVNKAGYN